MPVILIIIALLGLCLPSFGQLDQNFDSGGLELWTGQVDDFVINNEGRLQLMSEDGGLSTLQTPVVFPDSLSWKLSLELDFAPSTSNALDLWLAAENIDSGDTRGYKLSIGETGADDAIRFIWVENGNEELIATGDMGEVAEAFDLDLELTKDAADNWRLSTRVRGENLFTEAFMVGYEDNLLSALGSFGLSCKYTSTRTDKFYFDDILISELLPDSQAPSLVSAEVVNENKILLSFDEAIEETSAAIEGNYSFSNNVSIGSISYSEERPSEVCLLLMEALPSGSTLLTVSGIEDSNGNLMTTTEIGLAYAIAPILGELVINEILYDPASGRDADYVELINISDNYLKLDSVFFSRANSSAKDVQIERGLVMTPGQILAFTPDKEEIEEVYMPIPDANLVQLKITNYVNGEGNVSIYAISQGIRSTLDSLDYSDDFHSSLLSSANTEGISLERISPLGDTNDPDNWFSAASFTNYGTPGYENSQRTPGPAGDEQITLDHKVFSPNGDGYQDLMRLNYSLDKTGYIGNIAVYDDHGRLETYLAENKLLGTEGTIIWEGLLDDGSLAPIGMYIIYYDIFHADGDVISGKKVCVLAEQLN